MLPMVVGMGAVETEVYERLRPHQPHPAGAGTHYLRSELFATYSAATTCASLTDNGLRDKTVKQSSFDSLEAKRNALYLIVLTAGVLFAIAYPLALLPVWARVTIAVPVYLVGAYADYSTTRWAVSRWGITAETNPLYRFAFRRFGLALGFLAVDAFLIGFMALVAYFALFPSFPDYLLVPLLGVGFSHLGGGLANWLLINAYRAYEKEKEQS
jgi:hypothetical protein